MIPGQLLGAIIPHGDQTWFFKLTGPPDDVKAQLEPFLGFIKSVRISETGPKWSLPEGWKQLPGREFRFATVKIPGGEEPLELTIIPLPTAPGKFEDYLLSNVNRWREQLKLGPIAKDELPEKTVKIEVDEMPAWLVNCEGQIRKSGTDKSPSFGRRSARAETAPTAPGAGALPFACTVPENWKPAQANVMQLAAYEVGEGDRKVTISISSAGGDLESNINRWRDQVHLAPLAGEELAKELRDIEVDGRKGVFVDLVGPEDDPRREALLGVIVASQRGQWFIKLRGDVAVAGREKEHFDEFVHSIRFRGEK
jgi:hypothetical protein